MPKYGAKCKAYKKTYLQASSSAEGKNKVKGKYELCSKYKGNIGEQI